MNDKKIAVITGASKGIGKAIAIKFASENVFPVLIARNQADLINALVEIKSLHGDADYYCCDVSIVDDVQRVIKEIVGKYHKIDILVNCAGRSGGGVTADIDPELWTQVINTNLNSVFYVTKFVMHYGNMQPGSTIINIASTGGKQGVVYGAPYSAAKHGVVGFTKALGLELAQNKKAITVNAICPGFVETDMAKNVRKHFSELWQITEEETKKRIEARIPIGRYIVPEEIADMAYYLTTSSARSITAQAINLCGGLGNY
jgi:ketoreductase